MKTTNILIIALAITLLICAVSTRTLRVVKTAVITNSVIRLSQDTFNTGFKLGWACGKYGGTTNDGQLLMDAFASNDIVTVTKWFNEHK